MLCANISQWGPKAEAFLEAQKQRRHGSGETFDVIAMAETHLAKGEHARAVKACEAVTHRAVHAHARPTGRSEDGTSGGVLMAPCVHLQLANVVHSDDKTVPSLVGDDWCAVPVRLGGCNVWLAAAYLTCGIGPTGANVAKLQQLGQRLLATGEPFIVAADWNMAPGQLCDSGFLRGRVCCSRCP